MISSENSKFYSRYYLHFIPFLLVVIYGIIFVYFRSIEFKLSLIHSASANPLPAIQFISYLKPLHGIIYVFLTIKVVKIYNIKIRNSYSNIERINLNWLRYLTTGLSIVWGLVVVSYAVNAFSSQDVGMDHLIYMAASVLIYSIGYFSLRQPQILEPVYRKQDPEKQDVISKPAEAASYQKSGLTESEAQNYLKSLLLVMETDKPYLDSDLVLRELAGKLSISTHKLSEVLNTRLKQNFYDFINSYRVEEVKRRLSEGDSEKYSLLAIAFDSGFNSKSAFNMIFKKHTGQTPSQYRRQIYKFQNPNSGIT